MKKLLISVSIVLLLVGCGKKEEKAAEVTSTAAPATTTTATDPANDVGVATADDSATAEASSN
ncbi:MAG: hypothetical protein Q4P13_11415 [Psychrobacter sp.]|nr:hypothetical protein [Psychrobacter sp.]